MESTLAGLFGKMSPELFRPDRKTTEEQTSTQCYSTSRKLPTPSHMFLNLTTNPENFNGSTPGKWQVKDGAWDGERWTRNGGEYPSVGAESTLSSILEENAPDKYYLSAKACMGILRRASERGKELPEILKEALEQQVTDRSDNT